MATPSTSGIVINELLCFVTNKCDLLPAESISQLCCATFEESEIEQSKKLLYDICADHDTPRMILRKGPKKSSQNIEDILKLVQEKGTDLPTFVAHNLQLLPPIGFDSLDVSTLLHTIKKTQTEVQLLKEGLKSQAETVNELSQRMSDGARTVQVKRSGTEAGVMSSSVQTEIIAARKEETTQTEADLYVQEQTDVTSTRAGAGDHHQQEVVLASGSVNQSVQNQEKETHACDKPCEIKGEGNAATVNRIDKSKHEQSISSNKGAIPKVKTACSGNGLKEVEHAADDTNMKNKDSYADKVSEWKTVTRVGGKLKSVREGSHLHSNQIKTVNEKKKHVDGSVKNTGLATVKKTERKKYASIFASRFGPGVTGQDLEGYLEDRTGLRVIVTDVRSRFDTYRSFHVFCECEQPGMLLRDEIWPEGAYVRWWRGDFSQIKDNPHDMGA